MSKIDILILDFGSVLVPTCSAKTSKVKSSLNKSKNENEINEILFHISASL